MESCTKLQKMAEIKQWINGHISSRRIWGTILLNDEGEVESASAT